jgi:hypothetical protein
MAENLLIPNKYTAFGAEIHLYGQACGEIHHKDCL